MKLNEETYRRIVSSMPEGVWLVSPIGKTLFCNERMAQILGTDIEALQKLSCFDPVFPEDLDEAHHKFKLQMVKGAKPFDFRLRRSDGSAVWVNISCSLIYDDSGGVKELLGLFTDITERMRVEAMLRESEKRFRTMADTAPAMIWVADPGGLAVFANKFWLDFTGRTMEQELGHGWTEGVHPEDLDSVSELHAAAFEARCPFRIEFRLRRGDGEYRTVLSHGVPGIESGGRFEGYIGSCIDITDLKRAHELDLARQKLETVGSASSAVVHDIGNLLVGIMAYSEMLLDSLASGSIPAEEVKSIRQAAIRGADMARQLMIYGEPETEVRELVNVSGIVEDVIELLKSSMSKHVVLEIHFDKQLATVRANPAQIRQIVLNLIMNASEAIGDRSGVIRVTTRQLAVGNESRISESGHMTATDYVELEVADTGRGMTAEVEDQIFDIFFTTKLSGIHGLGLTAVRWIVERLRGTIHVSSTLGEGTTFRVVLPFQ